MKYKITGQITVSAFIAVEADSKEAALEIAQDSSNMQMPSANLLDGDGEWQVEELDGEARGPFEIEEVLP